MKTIYKNSPLIEVVLQVKFPTILSINSIEPVVFQEAIRAEYPIYQVAIENQQEISLQQSGDSLFPTLVQNQQQKHHMFITMDGLYKIDLTSSFISISTLSYYSWENLFDKFETPFKQFVEIYNPAFIERVGLRYVDAYSKKKLNIEHLQWRELIQPHLLGELVHLDEKDVISSSIDTEYLLDDNISRVKIHAGLGNINNDPEKVFVIDSDFIHINSLRQIQV